MNYNILQTIKQDTFSNSNNDRLKPEILAPYAANVECFRIGTIWAMCNCN